MCVSVCVCGDEHVDMDVFVCLWFDGCLIKIYTFKKSLRAAGKQLVLQVRSFNTMMNASVAHVHTITRASVFFFILYTHTNVAYAYVYRTINKQVSVVYVYVETGEMYTMHTATDTNKIYT